MMVRHSWSFFTVLLLLILLIASGSAGVAQPALRLAPDPAAAEFVLEDLHNFVGVMERLSAGGDSLHWLQTAYFDKGSIGLQTFVARQDFTASKLLDVIRKRPADFDSIAMLPARLTALDPALREAFGELQRLYPSTVFPPTYFFVGPWTAGGEASAQGLLISLRKVDHLLPLVTHELVHFQQAMAQGVEQYRSIYGPQKSLLALSIREGTADFVAALATGRHTQEAAYAYVLENEAELWARFQTEMLGADTGDWMWVSPPDSSQPRDVGYALGHRIVETFYERAVDKEAALEAVFSVTDYQRFLRESGYGERVSEAASH